MGKEYFRDFHESTICVDSACSNITGYGEVYVTGTSELIKFSKLGMNKVGSSDDWIASLNTTINNFQITVPGVDLLQVSSSGSFPDCINPISCPTEEHWKLRDPLIGSSPYVEPSGVLEAGFIAGITVASVVVGTLISLPSTKP